MNTLDEMIEVIQARKEGKIILWANMNQTAYKELDKDDDRFNFYLHTYMIKPEIQTAKCWEELGTVSGWYADDDSQVSKTIINHPANENNKNVWATKEQAEASLAMSQLSQLMRQVNGDWKPDWVGNGDKYVIYYFDGGINTAAFMDGHCFLSFETAKIRNTFLENHRELIEQAKPLL